MAKPQTVEEYVSGFSGPARELLDQLCALAREIVPQASEAIKWGYPAWIDPSGTILFAISGHAKHAGVMFTPTTRDAFDEELKGLETGKGTVKLPYGEPIPTDLLRRMMTHRVREHEDQGVLWM